MQGWNRVATFQHPSEPSRTVLALVVARQTTAEDVQLFGLSPGYNWQITWDAYLTYPDDSKIGPDHRFLCAGIFGTDGQGTPRGGIITKPRPDFANRPHLCAFVKELS